MYCSKHWHASLGLLPEQLDYPDSCGWVETTCRFIEEHQGWFCDHFIANWCSFALATRNSSSEPSSDQRVGTCLEAHHLHGLINCFLEFFISHISANVGSELEELPDGVSSLQYVVLLYKCSHFPIVSIAQAPLVDRDFALDNRAPRQTGPLRQRVQQGCFAWATWAQNGNHLLWLNIAIGIEQDLAEAFFAIL